MSKLYNDFYVKEQTPRCATTCPKPSPGRGPIETLVCVAIGSVITLVLCGMSFALMKPLLNVAEEYKQEQQAETDLYNKILNGEV